MGRWFLALLLVLVAVLGGRRIYDRPVSTSEPLRVGLLVWPPYEFGFLARSLGEYDGSAVELVDYRTPAEAMRAYRNGLIDAVALTADYFLQLVDRDPGHRVVYVIDFSNGGDALVARDDIDSLAALAGKRVGVEASALGAHMLTRVLDHAGLDTSAIVRVAVDTADQEEAFLSGRIDAVITYDPTRTRLLKHGARSLFDSSQIPGEIVDVLICHRDTIARRRAQLSDFLRGWTRAVEYLEREPVDGAARVAQREHMTAQVFLESIDAAHIPSVRENLELLSSPTSPLLDAMRRSADLLRSMGLVDEPSVTSELLDASILRELDP